MYIMHPIPCTVNPNPKGIALPKVNAIFSQAPWLTCAGWPVNLSP